MYRMKEGKFPKGINAVIFLLHKPVGLGTREKVISVNNEEYIQFIKYISEEKLEYKVGFDSCTGTCICKSSWKDRYRQS